ncbi:MAG: HAD family phosphatase [Bryobacteraceae bacterium]
MAGPYDAVLFDFDGVLVDSEPLHFECWNQILHPYGFQLSWEEYEANCIGVSDRAMISALCRVAGRDDWFDGIWQQYPRKKEIFRSRMAADLPMPADTRELLLELAAQMPIALVSSSGRLEIEPALEAAGVRSAFTAIVTGDDVRQLKPSPEPYQTAAARLGIRTALVVEDSEAGMESGRAAGFDVLAIRHATQTASLVRQRLAEPMPRLGDLRKTHAEKRK